MEKEQRSPKVRPSWNISFVDPSHKYLDTWNDAAVAAAWDAHAPPRSKGYFVYVASKTETERMAFKWVQEHKPSFTLNTVLPALTVYYPSALAVIQMY
jgi:hypothetical protein